MRLRCGIVSSGSLAPVLLACFACLAACASAATATAAPNVIIFYDGWNTEQAEPAVRDSKSKKQERKKKQREKEGKLRKKERREKAAGAAADTAS